MFVCLLLRRRKELYFYVKEERSRKSERNKQLFYFCCFHIIRLIFICVFFCVVARSREVELNRLSPRFFYPILFYSILLLFYSMKNRIDSMMSCCFCFLFFLLLLLLLLEYGKVVVVVLRCADDNDVGLNISRSLALFFSLSVLLDYIIYRFYVLEFFLKMIILIRI